MNRVVTPILSALPGFFVPGILVPGFLVPGIFATTVLVLGSPALAAGGRGFHVDLGVGAGRLELSESIRSSLAAGGVHVDPDAAGADFRFGYGFGPHLRLDLAVAALDLRTGRPEVEGAWVETRLELVSRLARQGPVQPYLAGSLGGATLAFGPDADDLDDGAEADLVSFGGGVEVELSRRWTMGFDYRYGLSDFDDEAVELPRGTVLLDGSATSHLWGLRFQFGF